MKLSEAQYLIKEFTKDEGIKEGEARAFSKAAIKLLTKKFGPLTEDIR